MSDCNVFNQAERATQKMPGSKYHRATGLTQRFGKQGDGMFATLTGRHLNLPFTGFAVGDDDISAAFFNLAE